MAYLCSSSTSDITILLNKAITTKSTITDITSLYTKQVSQIIGSVNYQYTVTPTTESVVKTVFEPVNSTTTPITGKSRPLTGQFWPR
jgi:hypothetical protein